MVGVAVGFQDVMEGREKAGGGEVDVLFTVVAAPIAALKQPEQFQAIG